MLFGSGSVPVCVPSLETFPPGPVAEALLWCQSEGAIERERERERGFVVIVGSRLGSDLKDNLWSELCLLTPK